MDLIWLFWVFYGDEMFFLVVIFFIYIKWGNVDIFFIFYWFKLVLELGGNWNE